MNSAKIPVVFSIDNEYVKQLSVVIKSILDNSDSEFEFNVLSQFISGENKERLQSIAPHFNFFDISAFIKDLPIEKYMYRKDGERYNYISIETYFRFFISRIFTKYDKIIYLDADILVLDDLSMLYNENIDGCYAGVVQDVYIKFVLANPGKFNEPVLRNFKDYLKNKLGKNNDDYFNAGVLLLNLKQMRQDNIESKLWEFAQKESPLRFQDQDVLNSVFDRKTKFLAPKWNVFSSVKHADAGIVHFTGLNKPWIFRYTFNYDYDFIEKWWKYYASTPYFKKKDLNILKGIKNIKRKKFELKIGKFILFSIVKETPGKMRVIIFNKLNRVIKIKPKYRENRL